MILEAISFPIILFGFSVILVIRLGWVSLVGIVIVIIQIPIANRIAKKNGEIITEANLYKDSRVQVTTEVIEGIKYTKLYGW